MSNYSYRFKEGDLIAVAKQVPDYIAQGQKCAPIMVGLSRRMSYGELTEGHQYLVISDASESSHHDNKKLYVEVMTATGPALCWCSLFKMKPERDSM